MCCFDTKHSTSCELSCRYLRRAVGVVLRPLILVFHVYRLDMYQSFEYRRRRNRARADGLHLVAMDR